MGTKDPSRKEAPEHWTVTPKRTPRAPEAAGGAGRPRGRAPARGGRADARASRQPHRPATRSGGPAGGGAFGGTARAIPEELCNTILHDPKLRDPRGYIIPSDQADFATATEFVNALLKNGIAVHRAASAFQVAGKSYPAGSLVVGAAQPFRAHVMDMFEPQDHPNDFPYPGGPPKRPYDITGWTLAMQMGVQFDRVMDAFDGPFKKSAGSCRLPPCPWWGPPTPPAT